MILSTAPGRLSFIAGVIGAALLLSLTSGVAHAAAEDDDSKPGDYTVNNGKVDQGTYDGYIAYTRSCMACHGPDGLGSSFAPSLMKRSQQRTFSEFANVVAAGLQIQPDMVMPSFADDQYVLSNLENIYSYMQGRAAGDIGRGRPKVIEEEQGRQESASAEQ